jgi:hypothetical protein
MIAVFPAKTVSENLDAALFEKDEQSSGLKIQDSEFKTCFSILNSES